MFDSLLWLKESKTKKLNTAVIKDLNLYGVYEKLLEISEQNETFIYHLCMDKATIQYRQDILADFLATPDFIRDIENNLKGFRELKSKKTKPSGNISNFYSLIDLIITVETTVQCIEDLNQTLLYYKESSDGLLQLKRDIQSRMQTKEFNEMKQDLKEIRYIFNRIKGLEISINMSPGMRPYEAQITKVNDYPYKYPVAFRKSATFLKEDVLFLGNYLSQYSPVFKIGKVDWDLLDEIEYALREHKDILFNFLERYQEISIEPFIDLLEEVTFYRSSCDLVKLLEDNHLPLCQPKLLDADERIMHLKDCYSLSLAYEKSKYQENHPIIYNDLSFNDDGRIMILTGANRGGKTTITQAVGQIQVLAQLGLPVPASEAVLSLVDGVYTHFPVLEKETVDYGRFGKDCERFSHLFHQATYKSLLLLNESFSGTSYLESLQIAEEIVKAVKYKKIRMVYNTHLHELGNIALKLNQEVSNDTAVISMVTGLEHGKITYKIYEGEPLGISHAKKIAEKYNITFEQLMKRLEDRA